AVEAPGAAVLDDLEAVLVVPVEQLVGDLARGRLVGQLERLGTVPLDAHDRHEAIRQDTPDRRVGLEILERYHSSCPTMRRPAVSFRLPNLTHDRWEIQALR